MQRRTKLIAAGTLLAAGLAAGTGIAVAGGSDDADEGPDVPITGDALAQAEAAALAETGGGEVTETEAGDEESAYEVEVTMPDGTQIDVQLDEDFQVVGSETEGPEAGDDADD
jgi:hypothetical protein